MRFVVGLTGQIATGKSLVAKLFRYKNFHVIDCDIVARELMKPGTGCYKQVIREFSGIVSDSGDIDRSILGRIVFSDHSQLEKLNSIVHPFLVSAVRESIQSIRKDILIDAAVLIESGIIDLTDYVIMTDAYKYRQIERIQKRNGKSAAEAKRIIESQTGKSIMRAHADFVIHNNTDKFSVSEQVEKICRKLMEIKHKRI